MHNAIWYGTSIWARLGQVPLFCPLHLLVHSQPPPCQGSMKRFLSFPWLSISTTQQQLKHLCYHHYFHPKSLKHSVIQLLWGKLTVSQTKPWHWAFGWCHIPSHSQTTEGVGAGLRKSQSSIFSQRRMAEVAGFITFYFTGKWGLDSQPSVWNKSHHLVFPFVYLCVLITGETERFQTVQFSGNRTSSDAEISLLTFSTYFNFFFQRPQKKLALRFNSCLFILFTQNIFIPLFSWAGPAR